MKRRGQTVQRFFPMILLTFAVVLSVASLSAAVRTFAMPVEARTSEPWYSYKGSVGLTYTATVKQGRFYDTPRLKPDQMAQAKLPVDPPVYRRVILSKTAEKLDVTIPYSFVADRPAALEGSLRWEGRLVVPGIWEKPYPIAEPRQFQVDGTEISGSQSFSVPLTALLADQEAGRNELNTAMEPMELHIKPIFEIKAAGLRQPVSVSVSPDFQIILRTATVEIDEPKEVVSEKVLAETRIIPLTIGILGKPVTVATLRLISGIALALSLVLGVILVLLRRRRPDPGTILQKLGPSLVIAKSFDLAPGRSVADVRSAQEMVKLHAQTERPVIRVRETCYLLDGSTCYRLRLDPKGGPDSTAPHPAEHELEKLLPMAFAAEFSLDPWVTNIQVRSVEDFMQIQAASRRMVIRTPSSYHLIDGTVCYTYFQNQTAGDHQEAAPGRQGPAPE